MGFDILKTNNENIKRNRELLALGDSFFLAMSKESKRLIYVIEVRKARNRLEFGPDTQIFKLGSERIQGPYTTADHVVEEGFKRISGIDLDPTTTSSEIARQFGYQEYSEMPFYLQAAIFLAKRGLGDETTQEYLRKLKEKGFEKTDINRVIMLASFIKKTSGKQRR